jgi:DNA-binding NarL/FixJ family response regulator
MACRLGDRSIAARFLAAAHALLRAIGLTQPQELPDDYEQTLAAVRKGMEREAFEVAWAAGEAAPTDEIVKEVTTLRDLARSSPRDHQDAALARATGLSTDDIALLRLFAAGRANQEIAEALAVDVDKVTAQIARLYIKLGVDSRAGLTAYAFKHGIV